LCLGRCYGSFIRSPHLVVWSVDLHWLGCLHCVAESHCFWCDVTAVHLFGTIFFVLCHTTLLVGSLCPAPDCNVEQSLYLCLVERCSTCVQMGSTSLLRSSTASSLMRTYVRSRWFHSACSPPWQEHHSTRSVGAMMFGAFLQCHYVRCHFVLQYIPKTYDVIRILETFAACFSFLFSSRCGVAAVAALPGI